MLPNITVGTGNDHALPSIKMIVTWLGDLPVDTYWNEPTPSVSQVVRKGMILNEPDSAATTVDEVLNAKNATTPLSGRGSL